MCHAITRLVWLAASACTYATAGRGVASVAASLLAESSVASGGVGVGVGVGVVQVGAEVLVASKYAALAGVQRLGIVANPTSILPQTLQHIVDRMHADTAAGLLNLVCVFGPEHGFRGDAQAGDGAATGVDPQTNLTVYNTYGASVGKLTAVIREARLDGVVFDIQDVGARFYTYIWTMLDMMQASASVAGGFKFIVLDRPNPLSGVVVRGPVNLKSLPRTPFCQNGEPSKIWIRDVFWSQHLGCWGGNTSRIQHTLVK